MTQLIAKLVKASQLVGGKLKADKFNQEQHYGYISADKILAECGQALADNGVMVIPEIVESTIDATPYTSARGNALTRYDARVSFVMHICDDETSIKVMWAGLGSDFTAQDKAVYKAITSGHRYFLAKLLTVGEGNEDGEHEGGVEGTTTTTTAEGAGQTTGASTMPVCPKCGGEMWDNGAKVAQAIADGKKPGPLFACKKGKYNPTTKKTDGCDGKIWELDVAAQAPRAALPTDTQTMSRQTIGAEERAGDVTTDAEFTSLPAAPQSATAAVPTCPVCAGPMWDNRAKVVAAGKKPGPAWSCKAGKFADGVQTGCDGKYWPGEWPPRVKPDAATVDAITALSKALYGPATASTMKTWLADAYQITDAKGVKDGIEHLTPEQAAEMLASLQAEQAKVGPQAAA